MLLGDLRPELYPATAAIDHATVRWGSAMVEITDEAQLAQLQQALAAVQVKKQGRDYRHGNMFNEYEAYLVPTVNVVQFETADGQLISRFAFNGDCSQLEPFRPGYRALRLSGGAAAGRNFGNLLCSTAPRPAPN